MTPEREREIRDTQRRMEARAPLIGLHAAGARLSLPMSRDLLAEIDRLRALPVIATCGQCPYASDASCPPPPFCTHDDGDERDVTLCDPPPSWCPLRGGR